MWALSAKLQRLQPEMQRALHPASPAPYAAIVNACNHHVRFFFIILYRFSRFRKEKYFLEYFEAGRGAETRKRDWLWVRSP